jgi:hypothetical protein
MKPARPPCADDVERLLRRGRALRNAYMAERLRRLGTAIADLFSERPLCDVEHPRIEAWSASSPFPTSPWG